jgi:hypothetical protein
MLQWLLVGEFGKKRHSLSHELVIRMILLHIAATVYLLHCMGGKSNG